MRKSKCVIPSHWAASWCWPSDHFGYRYSCIRLGYEARHEFMASAKQGDTMNKSFRFHVQLCCIQFNPISDFNKRYRRERMNVYVINVMNVLPQKMRKKYTWQTVFCVLLEASKWDKGRGKQLYWYREEDQFWCEAVLILFQKKETDWLKKEEGGFVSAFPPIYSLMTLGKRPPNVVMVV